MFSMHVILISSRRNFISPFADDFSQGFLILICHKLYKNKAFYFIKYFNFYLNVVFAKQFQHG